MSTGSWVSRGCLLTVLAVGCSSKTICRTESCACQESDSCNEDDAEDAGTLDAGGGSPADADTGTDTGTNAPTETANVKFCSEILIDNQDTTLRLDYDGGSFEAATGHCSACREMPAGVVLTAQMFQVPQNLALDTYELEFEPDKEYVVLATVKGGQAGLLTAPGTPGSKCAFLDPWDGTGPPKSGPANVKFCHEVRNGTKDVTLRLAVNGLTFDATTKGCSACQDLPESTPLDFQILVMPEGTVGSTFTSTLDPGPGVVYVKENGEVIYNALQTYQDCEDAYPF